MVPHIQIHDELDFSIFNKEQSEMVIDKMINCVDMRVPLVVDYESGDNWGEAV
jgi:DNA polymerase I-like protein with 3'-5' exonuclease and polymerase domains